MLPPARCGTATVGCAQLCKAARSASRAGAIGAHIHTLRPWSSGELLREAIKLRTNRRTLKKM